MAKKMMVVGDKFYEFAKGKNAVTVSQLELITQIPANIIDGKSEFFPGQGIRDDFLQKIFENQEKNKHHNNNIDLSGLRMSVEKNTYSHKFVSSNTLIGRCSQLAENSFSLHLLIDERCELMADHQTGQHVQGMLLVEACRQTFIAVTEEFYMGDKVNSSYYVINNMNIDFSNFLFPLPATIHYELMEKDINERRARFKANVSILQNKLLCSSMSVSFTVYPSEVINAKESEMASATASAILNALNNDSYAERGAMHV
ncbi:hypothetical protein D4100_22930 [Serratia inhibens]|uniref:A-factor biosynthesis hotdog domain-containing protein n=1 Tax=Serratia inhibens TaxID=2338073 RepID=A0AA92X4E5_9GAMM|nr:AfsA-related hotdog domain-containing protein [Serratia inhibens]RJF53334.1 hypothetical protein D4100_22930 [Serratia inhibens]